MDERFSLKKIKKIEFKLNFSYFVEKSVGKLITENLKVLPDALRSILKKFRASN